MSAEGELRKLKRKMWNTAMQLLDLAGMAVSGFVWGRLYEKKRNSNKEHVLLDRALDGWADTINKYEKLKQKVQSQLNWKL